ncbi:hypothetical protein R1flu_015484 [Riccia fluitans]|uniref:2-phytyl-1,4-beta-naphthoquinone methyltransferase, chloroplastic n=1 Tax=Riccia fluitans TaxID=41844 RepID=A0ABD1YJ27_9MARC
MAAVGQLRVDTRCALSCSSVASTSFSTEGHAGNGKKLLAPRRTPVIRLSSPFQGDKERDSGSKITPNVGWQVKAVTSETLRSGTMAGVDHEAEVLKRQQLFNKIAPMYDNLNDWLSLGQHRVWKRMAVSWSGAKAGDTVLDICCGSGDLSFLLAQKVGRQGKVIGLDFAKEQLLVAAEREQNSPRTTHAAIEWIQGDALSLPFDDSSFDAITMGYGLRNVANIHQALAEIYRVLRPGKAASLLDFNRSPDFLTSQVQGFMLDNVVVPVATYFGVEEEYAYLKTSIACFPLGAEQEQLAADKGFSKALHYELAGGLMGVLVVTK